MSIRCKFKLEEITTTANYGTAIRLVPVSSGSEENKAFFKYTPIGEIKFSTVNEAAVAGLELGAEYYIDISKAP